MILKNFLLMLFIGLSTQITANDYTSFSQEIILLSDIIVEEGVIVETFPVQQSIILRYENAVRHDWITFENDDEKILQIIQAKEFFQKKLIDVLNAIVQIRPIQDFSNVYIPMIVTQYPLIKERKERILPEEGFNFGPFFFKVTLRYIESEIVRQDVYTKIVHEKEVRIDLLHFSTKDNISYVDQCRLRSEYEAETIFKAKKEFRNWIISQKK